MNNLIRLTMINFLLVGLLVLGASRLQSAPGKIISIETTQESPASSPTVKPTPKSIALKPTTFTQVTPVQSATIAVKPTTSPATPTQTLSKLDQVGVHNKQSDCWVTYNGGVYNITGYFGSHPGGDGIIAQFCGRDMTSAFNTMEKVPPKSHSQKAKQLLETFRI